MTFKVTSTEKRPGVVTISTIGSIDAQSHTILDERVDAVLSAKPDVIIFDMEFLDYINSTGVRVLMKAKKEIQKTDGKVILIKLQPQIKKVFDIIKALPTMQVFASIEELDEYLDRMQKNVH